MTDSDQRAFDAELVNAIISAYHTTRLKDCPVADHILSKPRVRTLLTEYHARAAAKFVRDFMNYCEHKQDCAVNNGEKFCDCGLAQAHDLTAAVPA